MAIVTQADIDAQRLIRKQIRYYKAIIRGLCERRNTHTAILKLPNEILSRISVEYKIMVDIELRAKAPKDYLTTLLKLTRICRQWRRIAFTTAAMWSTITLDNPTWVAKAFLVSKQSPLTVVGRLSRICSPQSPVNMLPAVMHAAPRFQDVDIKFTIADMYHSDVSAFLFRSSLGSPKPAVPLLRTLKIDYDTSDEDHVHGSNTGYNYDTDFVPVLMPFPWTGVTSLKSLVLRNLVPTMVPSMPSLTHLDIKLNHLDDIHLLSVPRVIDVLRNAPAVESVKLSPVSSDNYPITRPIPTSSQLVKLPKLRELNITLAYIKESVLFGYLDAPALRNTVISYHNDGDDPDIRDGGDLSHLQYQVTRSIPSDAPQLHAFIYTNIYDPSTAKTTYQGRQSQLRVCDDNEQGTHYGLPIIKLSIPGYLPLSQSVGLLQSLTLRHITGLNLGSVCKGDSEALAWSHIIIQLVHLRFLSVDELQILSILSTAPESSLHNVKADIPFDAVKEDSSNDVYNPELERIDLALTLDSEDEREMLRSICDFRHSRHHPLQGLWVHYFSGAGKKEYREELWKYRTSFEWEEACDSEFGSDDDEYGYGYEDVDDDDDS